MPTWTPCKGTDALLQGMPGTSLTGLIDGNHELSVAKAHQILIFDPLMNSQGKLSGFGDGE